MASLNAVLRGFFALIQKPLAGFDPMWGVILWSIPIGIFALFVFKKSSNQDAIVAAKNRIYACLFEIRLFNDRIGAILRAQVEIFRHVLTYQRHSLVPMVWILPPLVLVMVHLHPYYGYSPFRPGDQALFKVQLDSDWREHPGLDSAGGRPPVDLQLPAGVHAETPAVWLEALDEVVWRLAVDDWGQYDMVVHLGNATYTKHLVASADTVPVGFERPDRSFWAQLEWPAEEPLPPGSPVRAMTLSYPPRAMSFLGLEMEWEFGWMVYFFAFTMVIAFALRKKMGVEF